MPPLTSVTATPTLNSLLSDPKSLQLPLHVYIYIYSRNPFIYFSSIPLLLQLSNNHNFPFLLVLPSSSTKKNTSKNSKLTLTGVPISPWHLPLLDKHNDLSILFATTSSTVVCISISRVCMCITRADWTVSRRRTIFGAKNNATRRKKRGKTRTDRTLTRRARPEAFPRDGNRLWAPELAAPLGRRTHAAVRMRQPAPTTGPAASGGERQPSYLDLLVFTPARVYVPHLLHLRIFLLRWQHLTLGFAPCFYLTVA